MICKLFDDLLQGLWAYSVNKGVSEENACYLARIQILMFEIFVFMPTVFIIFTSVDIQDAYLIIGVVCFSLVLESANHRYINKKQLFKGIDLKNEITQKKIMKCNIFYFFLFIYVPLTTYLLSTFWS